MALGPTSTTLPPAAMNALDAACAASNPRGGLVGAPPLGPPPFGAPDDAFLLALARARPELAWPTGRDIALAQNAHETNTRTELAAALRGDFDWMEGDVAIEGGRPVMRHRSGDPVDLDLDRWVQFIAASGRGAKFDLKDPAALPAVLDLAQRAGIPQHRLIFNVGALPAEALQTLRRRYPDAIVNLSPVSDADLTPADLAELQVAARIVGGRIMFPIRIDLLSPHVIGALRPFGRVAIWNQPQLWNPRHDERERLRAQGVDGMIDLREPVGAKETFQSAAIGVAARVFGWDPVHKALDALGLL